MLKFEFHMRIISIILLVGFIGLSTAQYFSDDDDDEVLRREVTTPL